MSTAGAGQVQLLSGDRLQACAAAPRVWVGPEPDPLVEEAVHAAGGVSTTPAEAEVVIWLHREPSDLHRYLHSGVSWVQLAVSGVDSWIDDPILTSGPRFTSARGAYASAVAEHALALLLVGARSLADAARSSTWGRLDTRMLSGASVAVVGAGGIGQELIRYLQPFNCRILAVNRAGSAVDGAHVTLPVSRLDDVCRLADYVVLAAPGTQQTRALIGAVQLARMSSEAWIVNVGRGTLVDTEALRAALASGSVRGAALDVTDPEPLPSAHPLWREPRCLITSHSANPAEARLAAIARRAADNLRRYAAGDPLIAEIDVHAGI